MYFTSFSPPKERLYSHRPTVNFILPIPFSALAHFHLFSIGFAVSAVFFACAKEEVIFMTIGSISRDTCTISPFTACWYITITFSFYTTKALEFSCTPSISIIIFAYHNFPIPEDRLSMAVLFSYCSRP